MSSIHILAEGKNREFCCCLCNFCLSKEEILHRWNTSANLYRSMNMKDMFGSFQNKHEKKIIIQHLTTLHFDFTVHVLCAVKIVLKTLSFLKALNSLGGETKMQRMVLFRNSDCAFFGYFIMTSWHLNVTISVIVLKHLFSQFKKSEEVICLKKLVWGPYLIIFVGPPL